MLPRRALMNDKIVSAQGENLSLVNVKGSKLNALSVYGKSTQSGTPSPDNPVPIVSAGDSGEINVTVSGKNLIPFPYLPPLGGAGTVYEADGVTYTVQADGGIKCVGTPTNKFGPKLCRIRFSEEPLNASGSATNGKVTLSGGPLFFDPNNNVTFIYWDNQVDTPVDMTIYPQVEYGTVATAYEPYKTPQTLTLSTPGGLPGIPVASGGNYTDAGGQQWICNEVDFDRGKYVQRVKKVTNLTFTKATFGGELEDSNLYVTSRINNMYTTNNYPPAICSNLIYDKKVLVTEMDAFYIYDKVIRVRLKGIKDDEVAAATLKTYTFIYPLATPIETDLSDEELAAYKALYTYSPTTTVSNDTGAWVKVGYREYRR